MLLGVTPIISDDCDWSIVLQVREVIVSDGGWLGRCDGGTERSNSAVDSVE